MPSKALIPPSDLQHNVEIPQSEPPKDLRLLAQMYFASQVQGQAPGTMRAKRDDLQHFLEFYFDLYQHYEPAEWYPAVTREWLNKLKRSRKVAPATAVRRYATIRHFARWAHDNVFRFPLGCPTEGIKAPPEPETDWHGLDRKNELRLIAAAQKLRNGGTGAAGRQGIRDLAMLYSLLGSGLRISELLALDLDQYDGKGFRDLLVKGNVRRRFVKLWGADPKQALTEWLKERGDEAGPLFLTRTGKRMLRDQAFRIIKRMEEQANAHLPEREKFSVTPHSLRHTLLKKLADQKGLHVAMKQSGHRSPKYIWRYVQPSDDALENGDDELD